MSRLARTIEYAWLGNTIPVSEAAYLDAVFKAAALRMPDGVVKRKIITVEAKSSEAKLLRIAKARGLCVSMLGGYYLIYHPGIAMISLT